MIQFNELSLITSHPIPRYHLVRGKEVKSLQLHGFSDASDYAYAEVIYLVLYIQTRLSLPLCFWPRPKLPLYVVLLNQGMNLMELSC